MNVKQLKELLENYLDDTKIEVLYGTLREFMFAANEFRYSRTVLTKDYIQYNKGENTLFLGYDV